MQNPNELVVVNGDQLFKECTLALPWLDDNELQKAVWSCLSRLIKNGKTFKVSLQESSKKFKRTQRDIKKLVMEALPSDYLKQKISSAYHTKCVSDHMVAKMDSDANQHLTSIMREQCPNNELPPVESYNEVLVNKTTTTTTTISETPMTEVSHYDDYIQALRNTTKTGVETPKVVSKTHRACLGRTLSVNNNGVVSQIAKRYPNQTLEVEDLTQLVDTLDRENAIDGRAKELVANYYTIRLIGGFSGDQPNKDMALLNVVEALQSTKNNYKRYMLYVLTRLIILDPKDPLKLLVAHLVDPKKSLVTLREQVGVQKSHSSFLSNLLEFLREMSAKGAGLPTIPTSESVGLMEAASGVDANLSAEVKPELTAVMIESPDTNRTLFQKAYSKARTELSTSAKEAKDVLTKTLTSIGLDLQVTDVTQDKVTLADIAVIKSIAFAELSITCHKTKCNESLLLLEPEYETGSGDKAIQNLLKTTHLAMQGCQADALMTLDLCYEKEDYQNAVLKKDQKVLDVFYGLVDATVAKETNRLSGKLRKERQDHKDTECELKTMQKTMSVIVTTALAGKGVDQPLNS